MKHFTFFRAVALMLVLAMAFSLVGCSEAESNTTPQQGSFGKLDQPNTDQSDTQSESDEPYVYSVAAQSAIEALNSNHYGELFAAAYLGYRDEDNTDSLVEWLYNNCPMLKASWAFLEEIPEEDIIGEYGDLYCVVPMDESVTFTVKSVEWETLGNGTTPHYSEPMYYAEVNRPFLMYVNYGDGWEEANLTVEFEEQDGFVGTWFPQYNQENACLQSWTQANGYEVLLDFEHLNDNDYDTDVSSDDMYWLPAVEVVIGDTTWYSDNGWMLVFGYDENAESGSGGVVLYEPKQEGDEVILSRYFQGVWWLEDDSKLYIDAYNDRGEFVGGLFPVRLSPSSGELMRITRADDGTVLPFFEDGQTISVLTLSYG